MSGIINHQRINDRGEGLSPRVDLIVLGQLLDRAALGVERLRLRLRAAGESPGPEPEDLERELIAALREVRSVRTRSRRRVPCKRTRR